MTVVWWDTWSIARRTNGTATKVRRVFDEILRSVLYSRIARAYIPAPAANFVRVVINGESWGIYINSQQFNKDFVKNWFGTTSGARWKVPGQSRRTRLRSLGENAPMVNGRW